MRIGARLPWPRLLLILAACVGLAACDRVFSEDPDNEPDEGLALGTFEGQVGEMSNQGFEALEGPATFALLSRVGAAPVLVLQLRSQLPNFDEPTTLDFAMITSDLPAKGTYGIGHPNEGSEAYFAACFRSPNFQEAPYESESGEVVVKTSGSGAVEGTFEMTAYALVSTGPASSARVRLEIFGSFHARNGSTDAQPDAIFDCVEDA